MFEGQIPEGEKETSSRAVTINLCKGRLLNVLHFAIFGLFEFTSFMNHEIARLSESNKCEALFLYRKCVLCSEWNCDEENINFLIAEMIQMESVCHLIFLCGTHGYMKFDFFLNIFMFQTENNFLNSASSLCKLLIAFIAQIFRELFTFWE